MRTTAPSILPVFRSEMQIRLLGLLLLQPERNWTLHELAGSLNAPVSSVHRELSRAAGAGIIRRDAKARPHRFLAATDDPFYGPLSELLRLSVGVEEQLRTVLSRPGVLAALIHGSWPSPNRRPDSDIDVLVVGDADLQELRRLVRPIGKAAGRTIDLTLFSPAELQSLVAKRSGFLRGVLEHPTTPLVGDLNSIAQS